MFVKTSIIRGETHLYETNGSQADIHCWNIFTPPYEIIVTMWVRKNEEND